MARCLVSFGANLGDASGTIRAAVALLREKLGGSHACLKLSRFFRTPPIGGPTGQPPFVNAVAAVSTERNVWEMWNAVREVEFQLGRTRNQRWEARPIDIDILIYDDQRIWTPQFKVPHPRMCMRRFILAPAVDVAAEWADPVTGQTILELYENVRSGPSSLTLVAGQQDVATNLLQQAARQALARWRTHEGLSSQLSDLRWVEVSNSLEENARAGDAASKLVVVLADPMKVEGVLWEDFCRALAIDLNLVGGSYGESVRGPRYLLPSDDPAWAVHELVAALDAMDCPVEPLE